jgi:phenylalanyl-tRNA synthetase beta chain
MHISIDWLKDFVDIPKGLDPLALANELTLKTAEVEAVHQAGKDLEGVVIGELLEIKKHPNADKLNLAKVDIGKKQPLSLIFGQMVAMKIGNKVPVAVAPTTLPTGNRIEKREMRGIMSEGMLCLDQELGLAKEGVTIQYFPNLKPGTPLIEALGLEDTIFEFDNKALTNRPDLWGHYGIAREIAAITNKEFKPLNPNPKIPSSGESVKVEIKDFKLCPRYCGLIINNIKVEESPDWLKKRLKATEHGTHNNIVDVTNYVMTELGQPMHAFDKNYIKKGIIVRKANPKEKITTLDKKERLLSEETLVIADHEKPVAIAGIIGGENSEISTKTTSIILESANFHAGSLRRTSTILGLRTDSVQRFEKSLEPNLAEFAIKRATELILKICPQAKIAGPITDVQKFNKKPVKITLNLKKTKSKIGVDISAKEIKEILEKLSFKVSKKSSTSFLVTVPSYRSTKDILIEDDLIEEVARIHGYENIPHSLPLLPTRLPEENTERFKKHKTRELFSFGLGFNEVYNYSFYGMGEIKKCLMTEGGHIKLLNYLSEDQTHLRTSLVPNLLKNIQLNIKYFDQFKLYEIGHTYKEIGQYHPLEEKKVSGVIVKKEKTDNVLFEAKGAVEAFIEKFNIQNVKTAKEVKNAPYAHPSKALSYIDKNGQTLAQVFILHPAVRKNHDLDQYSIAIFEINFTEALSLDQPIHSYKKLSKFPGINIDVSVVIDKTAEIQTIKEKILEADKNLIKEAELFDIYEGQNIEKGKKAVAFKISLQAEDRTLTDEEMSKVQQQIVKNLEKLGGTIRGK